MKPETPNPDTTAPENAAPDFQIDLGPPNAPVMIDILPAGNATFHAKMAGGYLLIERSSTPFAAAAKRLIDLGVDPARIITMTVGGVTIRTASLADAAGGGL